jgi:hypothetical protein
MESTNDERPEVLRRTKSVPGCFAARRPPFAETDETDEERPGAALRRSFPENRRK